VYWGKASGRFLQGCPGLEVGEAIMGLAIFCLLCLLNFAISCWNAYVAGKCWVEARAVGGWQRIMCWCAAVMSASGFTWCYLIFLVLGAHYLDLVDQQALEAALNLGWLILIPGMLLSGLLIMLDSWARAFRQGGFLNYGLAAYNTYAQIHNTYSAITGFGTAFRSVSQFFGGGDGKGRSRDNSSGIIVVILLVAVALAAGVLTTTFIIWKVAATTPIPPRPSPQQFEDSARNVARSR
jgi:hypothetical protein